MICRIWIMYACCPFGSITITKTTTASKKKKIEIEYQRIKIVERKKYLSVQIRKQNNGELFEKK